MPATPAPQRIELSPAVRAILEADTPKSQLLRHFLHFTEAILAPDPAGIDRVVSADARFQVEYARKTIRIARRPWDPHAWRGGRGRIRPGRPRRQEQRRQPRG